MYNPFKKRQPFATSTEPVMKLRNAMAGRRGGGGGYMSYLQQVDSYKKGGIVKKTGLAYVHKGEKVIPAKKVKAGKAGAKKTVKRHK